MLTVNAASGFGSGGGPSYACDAVVFDGSNDYGVISGAFSGPPADTKLHTTSFWIKLNGDGSTYRIFSHSTGGHGFFQKTSSNKMQFSLYSPSDVDVLDVYSSSDWVAADGWTHFLIAIDSDDDWYMYKNGVLDKGTETQFASGAEYDLNRNKETFASSQSAGSQLLNADMADVYVTNEFVNDVGKFAKGGKPIDLGSDGSLPSGTAPIVFLHVDEDETANNFFTNAGSGGNYTLTGALTTASTSPTD